MSLEEQLDLDLKQAMRASDTTAKLAIRAVKTAILEAKVAGSEVRTLSDPEVQAIISKQVKQRRDSASEFIRGGRPELASKEEAEIKILQKYLPAQLDEAAIRERAQAVIAELGVAGMNGLGPVMRRLTTELRDVADGQVINRVVRDLLKS